MVRIKKKVKKTKEELLLEKQKKELEKAGIQDEFQAKGFELVTFIQLNSKLVMAFLSLVIFLGVGWSGYIYLGGQTSLQASAAYEVALDLLSHDDGKSEKEEDKPVVNASVITAMKNIENEFSGSKVAGLARLQAGFLLTKEEKFEEAIQSYRAFVGACAKNSKLRPLGLVGLAYAYTANNNQEQALSTFESIIFQGYKIGRDVALWESARLSLALGNSALAQKRAAQIKKEYPISAFVSNAEEILTSVKIKD